MKSLIVRGDQIPSEGAKQASSLPAPNPPEHEFRSLLSGRVTLIVQTGVGEPALVRLIPLIPQVHQRTRRFFQQNLPTGSQFGFTLPRSTAVVPVPWLSVRSSVGTSDLTRVAVASALVILPRSARSHFPLL